nr:rab-like protein 2B isoform X4 [Globicephala melas]
MLASHQLTHVASHVVGAAYFQAHSHLDPLSIRKAVEWLTVFDVQRKITYKNLSTWYAELREFRPEIPCIVVANKIDDRPMSYLLSTADIKMTQKSFSFARKFSLPLYFVSAADGTNVVKLFSDAIRLAVSYKQNSRDFMDEVLQELEVGQARMSGGVEEAASLHRGAEHNPTDRLCRPHVLVEGTAPRGVRATVGQMQGQASPATLFTEHQLGAEGGGYAGQRAAWPRREPISLLSHRRRPLSTADLGRGGVQNTPPFCSPSALT